MNDLMDFLTSQEALVVYIIATASCLICMIIYFVEKGNVKRKQKHNTKELNKIIEKVKKEMHLEKEPIEEYNEPIIESVEEIVNTNSVDELLENTKELKPIVINENPTTLEIKEEKTEDIVIEKMDLIEEVLDEKELEVVRINKEDSDIQYTTVEPDQETAKLELNKLKEELEKEEQIEKEKEEVIESNNIKLTSFEEEQESTAIISLEELIKKSKEMYEKNEINQYMEENTAPISLEELALQAGVAQTKHEEPFIIDQVVLEEREEVKPEEVKKVVQMQMDDFKTVKTPEVKKFKSSPIISPIFGIEKTNDLELENTANFEKLDKEINKSNEFLVSLQDLQEKLKG